MFLIKNLLLPNQKLINWQWDGTPTHLQGPNGVGKSLFLQAIASLYPVSFDAFHFDEKSRDLINPQLYRSQVIYLSSQLSMSSYETAHDFYMAPLKLQIYKNHIYPSDLILQLNEWGLLEKRCSELSSGEKQVLNLLRALSLKPRVLLMDEALSNLDVTRKDWILSFIHQKYESNDLTYILVSHEPSPTPYLNQVNFSELLC